MLRTLAQRVVPVAQSRREGRVEAVNNNGTYDITVGGLRFTQVESLLGAEYRVGQGVAVAQVGSRLVIET